MRFSSPAFPIEGRLDMNENTLQGSSLFRATILVLRERARELAGVILLMLLITLFIVAFAVFMRWYLGLEQSFLMSYAITGSTFGLVVQTVLVTISWIEGAREGMRARRSRLGFLTSDRWWGWFTVFALAAIVLFVLADHLVTTAQYPFAVSSALAVALALGLFALTFLWLRLTYRIIAELIRGMTKDEAKSYRRLLFRDGWDEVIRLATVCTLAIVGAGAAVIVVRPGRWFPLPEFGIVPNVLLFFPLLVVLTVVATLQFRRREQRLGIASSVDALCTVREVIRDVEPAAATSRISGSDISS
jgi:hypothetical protein